MLVAVLIAVTVLARVTCGSRTVSLTEAAAEVAPLAVTVRLCVRTARSLLAATFWAWTLNSTTT